MLAVASLAVLAALSGVDAYNNGLALTPQMGWNTWNHFGCGISEDTILSAASAMVANNLTQFGYECEWAMCSGSCAGLTLADL